MTNVLKELKRFGRFLGREAKPAIGAVEALVNADPVALVEGLPWADWGIDLSEQTGIPARQAMSIVMDLKAKVVAEIRKALK